jgi:hypothetical protein
MDTSELVTFNINFPLLSFSCSICPHKMRTSFFFQVSYRITASASVSYTWKLTKQMHALEDPIRAGNSTGMPQSRTYSRSVSRSCLAPAGDSLRTQSIIHYLQFMIPPFDGNQRFNTVFLRQFNPTTPPKPISLRYISIPSHLRLGLPSGLFFHVFQQGFPVISSF